MVREAKCGSHSPIIRVNIITKAMIYSLHSMFKKGSMDYIEFRVIDSSGLPFFIIS